MLSCIGKTGESMKLAYTSVMDFAAIPFVLGTWYDPKLFLNLDWFGYGYLGVSIASYIFKEIVKQYKELNPDLPEEQFSKIIKIIDSTFKGIQSTSEMIFPAIVIDIIYHINDLFSKESLKIIHPAFIGLSISYGAYKGLEHYGIFKKEKDIPETQAINKDYPSPQQRIN